MIVFLKDKPGVSLSSKYDKGDIVFYSFTEDTPEREYKIIEVSYYEGLKDSPFRYDLRPVDHEYKIGHAVEEDEIIRKRK